MGKFIISKRTNDEFQFNLKASNGEIILSSEGYKTKVSCKNGIESVQKNSPEIKMYEIKEAKNGKFHFNLKASNGQVIGTSQLYASEASCKNGIESVKKNSADDSKYDRKTSSNDKFYFNLKATNGQVIGSSEMYESSQGMESGIESVKNNAPDASVEVIE